MQSRARVLGEQLNPLLTVLPLGMLGSAVLFDLGALVSGTRFFAQVALWDMAAGLLAGLVAVGATLVDLIVAPSASAARRVLALEAGATGSMVVLFVIIWAVRAVADPVGVDGLFVVEVVALAAGVAGAWFARSIVAGDGLPERRRPSAARPLVPRPLVPRPVAPGAPTIHVAASPYVVPSQYVAPSWHGTPPLPGVRPPAIVRVRPTGYLVAQPVGQGSVAASSTTVPVVTDPAAWAAQASSAATLRANPSRPS